MQISSDFEDLLLSLNEAGARYLIIGGMALAFHDRPRTTKDLDVWVDRSPENARRVYVALGRFGAPLENLTIDDLQKPDIVYQIGVEPIRVDVLTTIPGVEFEDAWRNRLLGKYGSAEIAVIGRADLVKNKKATGRPQDLVDVTTLEQ